VTFIADAQHKSKFISELEVTTSNTTIPKCPLCRTADLRLRSGVTNGKNWSFYMCSNFKYGCEYQRWVN
jgi:DNA helicase IV